MKNKRTFKIVIAYENFDAAIHARQMSERLAARLEAAWDSWPFELFAVDPVREHAIVTAAAVDMIIIAARGHLELPVSVKDWIESWLIQKGSCPTALIALLHNDWIVSGKPPPICAYLQTIAERGNLDFFCNLGRWWQQGRFESAQNLPERSPAMPEEVAP